MSSQEIDDDGGDNCRDDTNQNSDVNFRLNGLDIVSVNAGVGF